MNLFKITLATLTVAIFAFGCDGNTKEISSIDSSKKEKIIYWVDSISELNDTQYPDNPDISIRSKKDGMFSHTRIKLERIGETFNIFILPKNENSDTV
ncbi:MAG: hypothetical protein P8N07_02410, partial [Flavobacteriales bacterium]|nr:hypothetical protein [Flavobacteriales bacterium]